MKIPGVRVFKTSHVFDGESPFNYGKRRNTEDVFLHWTILATPHGLHLLDYFQGGLHTQPSFLGGEIQFGTN